MGNLALGFSRSVYFMLAVVLGVIPGMFGLFIWNAYRSNRRAEESGAGYQPRSGAQRWSAEAEAGPNVDTGTERTDNPSRS